MSSNAKDRNWNPESDPQEKKGAPAVEKADAVGLGLRSEMQA